MINFTSVHLPKEYNNTNLKNICTPMFIAALFIVAKLWKLPKCLAIYEWLKNKWYVYIRWSINQPKKKRGNLTICKNMDYRDYKAK